MALTYIFNISSLSTSTSRDYLYEKKCLGFFFLFFSFLFYRIVFVPVETISLEMMCNLHMLLICMCFI